MHNANPTAIFQFHFRSGPGKYRIRFYSNGMVVKYDGRRLVIIELRDEQGAKTYHLEWQKMVPREGWEEFLSTRFRDLTRGIGFTHIYLTEESLQVLKMALIYFEKWKDWKHEKDLQSSVAQEKTVLATAEGKEQAPDAAPGTPKDRPQTGGFFARLFQKKKRSPSPRD